MEGRLSRINGRARLAVPIRGIVSNRVMEAIITIPYELPEYQQFNNLFTGWIQDHQPSSLMSMELPGKGSSYFWANFGLGRISVWGQNRLLTSFGLGPISILGHFWF